MREVGTEQVLRGAGALIIALALLLVPLVFPNFLVYQFSLVLTYAIAILGLNLLMGFNGQISVAHGVFFAIGGYTTAIFITRYGMNYLATLPFAAAMSALLGFVVGVPALRWQGLPLAFITFGLAVLVPPVALKLEPITKGATGISMPKPTAPAWFPGNQDTFIYFLCLVGVALCVLIAWRLTRGDTGRSLRATRDNGLIAESLGVNLTNNGSPLPDLQSSRFEGQSNFVNPGLFLVGSALDLELTPKWRAQVGGSYLRFARTEVIEAYLQTGGIDKDIGFDLFLSSSYRPLLNNHIILQGSLSVLLPGEGLHAVEEADSALYALTIATTFTW